MPAKLSYSHHQIEMACDACHGKAFSGKAEIEKRCRDCHVSELQAMEDSHGTKKFGDPRNSKWLQVLDARRCLSCHQEHVPERTTEMTVSQPRDFCVACHADVAQERPSHRGLDNATCASAGCHHYHDNRVLNEEYVANHLKQPDTNLVAHRPLRERTVKQRMTADIDTTNQYTQVPAEWKASLHAQGHANCSDCHQKGKANWVVDIKVCKHCHDDQFTQWTQGHHGMMEATLQKSMTTDESELLMRSDVHNKTLNCNSCHKQHDYNTLKAEADSCLGCHADEHSVAWTRSEHAKRWRENPQSGASCATCHMPRTKESGQERISVLHNISAMMRPQEKMLQPVCMNCHGYEFSLRSLSDAALIKGNFIGKPAASSKTVDWVQARKSSESVKHKGS